MPATDYPPQSPSASFAGYLPGSNKAVFIPSRSIQAGDLVSMGATSERAPDVTLTDSTGKATVIGYVQASRTVPDLGGYWADWTYRPVDASFPNDMLQRPTRTPFDDFNTTITPEQLQQIKEQLEAMRQAQQAATVTPIRTSPAPTAPLKPAAEKKKFVSVADDVERDLEIG